MANEAFWLIPSFESGFVTNPIYFKLGHFFTTNSRKALKLLNYKKQKQINIEMVKIEAVVIE